MKIPIIYEDENIIIIDKPAGLLVHPSASSGQIPTLIDYFPETKLAHRLDKDTSGLLILAKNEKIHDIDFIDHNNFTYSPDWLGSWRIIIK